MFTYTLLTGRALVRQYARNAADSSMYSDSQIDSAIQASADDLIRRAFLLPRVDQVQLTNGNNQLPVAWSAATAYQPGAVVSASGELYVCILANTNQTPPNVTYWTDTTIAGAGLPGNFRSNRLMNAYLTGVNINVSYPLCAGSDWADGYPYSVVGGYQNLGPGAQRAEIRVTSIGPLLEKIYGFAMNGQPNEIAFDTWTTGKCWPTPDPKAPYALTLNWNDLFTQWTAGTQGAWSSGQQYFVGDLVSVGGEIYQAIANSLNHTPPNTTYWVDTGIAGTAASPGGISFNIPDDLIRQVFMYGAPCLMQFTEPENQFAAQAAAKFDAFIEQLKGQASLGAQEVQSFRRWGC